MLTPQLGDGVLRLEPMTGALITSRKYKLDSANGKGIIQNAATNDDIVKHRCLLKTVRNLDNDQMADILSHVRDAKTSFTIPDG